MRVAQTLRQVESAVPVVPLPPEKGYLPLWREASRFLRGDARSPLRCEQREEELPSRVLRSNSGQAQSNHGGSFPVSLIILGVRQDVFYVHNLRPVVNMRDQAVLVSAYVEYRFV